MPKKVEIYIYTGTKTQHQEFWDPNQGPFAKSPHEDHQKIILISHSVRSLY